MKDLVWVDTSFLYAMFAASDQNHPTALKRWGACIRLKKSCVTSNLVVSELGTLLAYHFGHAVALSRIVMIRDSSMIETVYSDKECETGALLWWNKYSDQKFSFADCVSFEFMRRLGLKNVFTFDKDFSIAGYSIVTG